MAARGRASDLLTVGAHDGCGTLAQFSCGPSSNRGRGVASGLILVGPPSDVHRKPEPSPDQMRKNLHATIASARCPRPRDRSHTRAAATISLPRSFSRSSCLTSWLSENCKTRLFSRSAADEAYYAIACGGPLLAIARHLLYDKAPAILPLSRSQVPVDQNPTSRSA
jgi:hypothetical protein